MYFFRSKIKFCERNSAGHFAAVGCFRILPFVFFPKLLAHFALSHSVFRQIFKPVLHFVGPHPFEVNDFPLVIHDQTFWLSRKSENFQ